MFGWGISGRISCNIGDHVVAGECSDRHRKGSEGQGRENIGVFCDLLIFVELYVGMFVLAAAVFERPALPIHTILWHSALAAVLAILVRQAPGEEFAHAVMQMDSGSHGGGQVDDG